MDELPPSVSDFLRRRINSVEQLSVLLLLRNDQARTWTVDGIARELRSTAIAIGQRLRDLEALQVLAAPTEAGKWRYAPASPEMGEEIDRVLDAYRRRPDRVIEAIYTKPPEALLAFADAFRLKKEKP